MFCIDLWGFSIDPPYFSYNYVEQETPVLCIFTFHGPSRTHLRGVMLPSPSSSITPPHSQIHLLVILVFVIGNIVRMFDIVIEFICTMLSIFDLIMSE
jgi:hypothetical protein